LNTKGVWSRDCSQPPYNDRSSFTLTAFDALCPVKGHLALKPPTTFFEIVLSLLRGYSIAPAPGLSLLAAANRAESSDRRQGTIRLSAICRPAEVSHLLLAKATRKCSRKAASQRHN